MGSRPDPGQRKTGLNRREHGGDLSAAAGAGTGEGDGADGVLDPEAGMRLKSEEFAANGNRVYLPLAD
ncbi:hypothetical protein ACFW9F_04075 [Streptomyces sp. NPDC059506]|uniref:hypothetical protein n=1 Tax=Streptomyces TaxID=1883 RepID=UPI002174F00A|nr:hypothetical protein [Streptomyces sp. SCUT-3]